MEVTRIFDLLDRFQEKWAQKEDVFGAKENGEWAKYSTQQYIDFARLFAYGLIKMGFAPGDKIATVSNNRPEWNFTDMGMSMSGIVHVPIYPTISIDDYAYILDHSDAKLLLISDESLYKRLKPIVDEIPAIKDVYTFNQVKGAKNWMDIVELGRSVDNEEYKKLLEQRKNNIKEDDIVTIIYTSGTTGLSKGVMLSHKNFLYQAKQFSTFVQVDHRHRALSVLPLCHVLERVCCYSFQYLGMSVYYAENIGKIVENMAELKPHCFVTVPRLLERMYDKIMDKGKNLTGIKRKLFFWAVDLGLKFDFVGKSPWYKLKLAIANKLIFNKWRNVLGGNIRLVIVGGAALQERLGRVFQAAQIPVQEGYGLSETAPVIAFNHQKYPDIKIGTVGPTIGPEQEIKIADDGEILFRGPNLMLGYYKNEQLTHEVIDKDGWFHTGDIGRIEEGKFLKITDRKKEIFKLSCGKYIAPQVIENLLKESFFIEQVMVVGENEKFASALIVPSFEFLNDWSRKNNISYKSSDELITDLRVISKIKEDIEKCNKKLGDTERIKKFKLLTKEWTIDGGELSPTLKLKRKFVVGKYKHKIEEIYTKHEEQA